MSPKRNETKVVSKEWIYCSFYFLLSTVNLSFDYHKEQCVHEFRVQHARALEIHHFHPNRNQIDTFSVSCFSVDVDFFLHVEQVEHWLYDFRQNLYVVDNLFKWKIKRNYFESIFSLIFKQTNRGDKDNLYHWFELIHWFQHWEYYKDHYIRLVLMLAETLLRGFYFLVIENQLIFFSKLDIDIIFSISMDNTTNNSQLIHRTTSITMKKCYLFFQFRLNSSR